MEEPDALYVLMEMLALRFRSRQDRVEYARREMVRDFYTNVMFNIVMGTDHGSDALVLRNMIVNTFKAIAEDVNGFYNNLVRRVEKLTRLYFDEFDERYRNAQVYTDDMLDYWLVRPTSKPIDASTVSLDFRYLFDRIDESVRRIHRSLENRLPKGEGVTSEVQLMRRNINILSEMLAYAEIMNIMRERIRLAMRRLASMGSAPF